MSSGRRAKRERALAGRAYLDTFLLAYVRILRRLLRKNAAKLPPGQSPCHSCAFNPSTDGWPGFQSTMLGIIESIDKGTKFVCHEGLPTDEKGQWHLPVQPRWNAQTGAVRWPEGLEPPLCAGYAAIKDDPETVKAPLRTMQEVGRPPKRFRLELPCDGHGGVSLVDVRTDGR